MKKEIMKLLGLKGSWFWKMKLTKEENGKYIVEFSMRKLFAPFVIIISGVVMIVEALKENLPYILDLDSYLDSYTVVNGANETYNPTLYKIIKKYEK